MAQIAFDPEGLRLPDQTYQHRWVDRNRGSRGPGRAAIVARGGTQAVDAARDRGARDSGAGRNRGRTDLLEPADG